MAEHLLGHSTVSAIALITDKSNYHTYHLNKLELKDYKFGGKE